MIACGTHVTSPHRIDGIVCNKPQVVNVLGTGF